MRFGMGLAATAALWMGVLVPVAALAQGLPPGYVAATPYDPNQAQQPQGQQGQGYTVEAPGYPYAVDQGGAAQQGGYSQQDSYSQSQQGGYSQQDGYAQQGEQVVQGYQPYPPGYAPPVANPPGLPPGWGPIGYMVVQSSCGRCAGQRRGGGGQGGGGQGGGSYSEQQSWSESSTSYHSRFSYQSGGWNADGYIEPCNPHRVDAYGHPSDCPSELTLRDSFFAYGESSVGPTWLGAPGGGGGGGGFADAGASAGASASASASASVSVRIGGHGGGHGGPPSHGGGGCGCGGHGHH